MKKATITYEPVFLLRFSKRDLEALFKCSKIHYDHECREASLPWILHSKKAGFLHAARVTQCWPRSYTEREVMTMFKILEKASHLKSELQYKAAVQLVKKLTHMMMEASQRPAKKELVFKRVK